jgi:ATP-dependent DNA helicase RecG
MFQLGLVDTRGGGIKRMYTNQIKRFFPLPDYDFEDNKTRMTLTGKIIDPEFADILSNHPYLSFADVFLLDRVQKKKNITDEEYKSLKKLGFVEGRKPNIFLSGSVIEPLNNESLKAEYIRNKGFDDTYCKDMIIEYLTKWEEASRKQIENLLWDKLSDVLSDSSKYNKVTNLLKALKLNEKIALNKGKKWVLKK